MSKVFLVVHEADEQGSIDILEAWDKKPAAQHSAAACSGYVVELDIKESPAVKHYRIWIRFAVGGVEYSVEERQSIPMVVDAFEPFFSGRNWHGTITVIATSETEAIAKAQSILAEYTTSVVDNRERPPMVPRRESHVGMAGVADGSIAQ